MNTSRIEQLRKEINKHNEAYYVMNAPTISDYDFDMMVKELEMLEAENADPDSPTMRPGSDLTAGFRKEKHIYPMLSLKNSYEVSEISQFLKSGNISTVVVEHKYDGLSLELNYVNGNLISAVTRGDGEMGDVVTDNALTVAGVPEHIDQIECLPERISIRGEVVMPFVDFEDQNKARLNLGMEPFANPRNAASGSLKLQDASECAQRGLLFRAYGMEFEGNDFAIEEIHDILNDLGFETESTTCYGLSEISEVLAKIKADKDADMLPWAIDGAVIKANDYKDRLRLGIGTKYPNHAIAYKYPSEAKTTKLTGVRFQVGRTGRVTPVAEFEAVQLGGTEVVQCTLHNREYMQALDLHIGDSVVIEKGGEIIPKITRVIACANRGEIISFPEYCPECGELLNIDGADAKCMNPLCDSKMLRGIEHFCRETGIKGFGPIVVETVFENGRVKSISDLFRLRPDSLKYVLGKTTSEKLYKEVQKCRVNASGAELLSGLGIMQIGASAAKSLIAAFGSLYNVANVARMGQKELLMAVDGIGETAVLSLITYFSGRGFNLIIDLNHYEVSGVNMSIAKAPEEGLKSDIFAGKTFVVSGVFAERSREDVENYIISRGGKLTGSVSGKTTFLVAGSNAGPSKVKKARELGVKVIGEPELEAM